jgi:hypothetical protein
MQHGRVANRWPLGIKGPLKLQGRSGFGLNLGAIARSVKPQRERSMPGAIGLGRWLGSDGHNVSSGCEPTFSQPKICSAVRVRGKSGKQGKGTVRRCSNGWRSGKKVRTDRS